MSLKYSFEQEGNIGKLSITTHFDLDRQICCTKSNDEFFRIGGTAVNEILIREDNGKFAIEHYDLDMEGKESDWIIVDKIPESDLRIIFINIDIIDGGENVLRRYRISTYTGLFKLMNEV